MSDEMSDAEIKALEKAMKKAKRIASERASELHDLVEDRLPAAFNELPALSEATYEACQTWAEAKARYEQAQTADA